VPKQAPAPPPRTTREASTEKQKPCLIVLLPPSKQDPCLIVPLPPPSSSSSPIAHRHPIPHDIISTMTKIAEGQALPLDQITFKLLKEGNATDLTGIDLFKGKKVVLFGVPGAFTPTW